MNGAVTHIRGGSVLDHLLPYRVTLRNTGRLLDQALGTYRSLSQTRKPDRGWKSLPLPAAPSGKGGYVAWSDAGESLRVEPRREPSSIIVDSGSVIVALEGAQDQICREVSGGGPGSIIIPAETPFSIRSLEPSRLILNFVPETTTGVSGKGD